MKFVDVKKLAVGFGVGILVLGGTIIGTSPQYIQVDTLEYLPIKGRAPKTGYDRLLFKHWSDLDKDKCDTRAEILERDGKDLIFDSNKCVIGATIVDPYSGTTIIEEPGPKSAVDIDHLVSLSDAWQKGAQQLSPAEREQLANDPLNLVAVSDVINRQKSDGDAATWLPPNKAFRCEYVDRQIQVKIKYKLWITQAEHDAMRSILSTCNQ